MPELVKALQAQAREWQRDAAEQERMARRLSGVERSAAVAHGNTKTACANALQRLLVVHGLGETPKGPKP